MYVAKSLMFAFTYLAASFILELVSIHHTMSALPEDFDGLSLTSARHVAEAADGSDERVKDRMKRKRERREGEPPPPRGRGHDDDGCFVHRRCGREG